MSGLGAALEPLPILTLADPAAPATLVTPRGTIMNATPNPEVAADKARESYPKGNGQFED